MLDNGANIDAKDAKGMTSFHYSVKREHEDCVELLIERKANIQAKDNKNRGWEQMTSSPTIIALCKGERKIESKVDPIPVNSIKDSGPKLMNFFDSEEQQWEVYAHLDKHGFLSDTEPEKEDKIQTNVEINRAMKWNEMTSSIAKWNKFMKRNQNKVIIQTFSFFQKKFDKKIDQNTCRKRYSCSYSWPSLEINDWFNC